MLNATGFLVLFSLCSFYHGFGQTLWTGPRIVFEKDNYTDWSLEENQDRITDSVWITRKNNRGIFNIRLESEFDRINRTSPAGTEWANGSLSDGLENLTFTSWHETKQNTSASEVGVDKVLHLISEDIYLDIKFLSWASGGGGSGTGTGGGFSYVRSTPEVTAIETSENPRQIQVTQIASTLKIASEETLQNIRLYSVVGLTLYEIIPEDLRHEWIISTSHFSPGVYVLLVNDQFVRKLIIR